MGGPGAAGGIPGQGQNNGGGHRYANGGQGGAPMDMNSQYGGGMGGNQHMHNNSAHH